VDPAPWWSYEPGDLVKGLVKIHPDLAPTPVVFGNRRADYSSGQFGPDWVASKLVQGSRHSDAAVIDDGIEVDSYFVIDSVSAPSGPRRFELFVEGEALNVGVGLTQSFDAIPGRDGSKARATLEGILNGVDRVVRMALTRVSLTPGMCRPN
jgi:hypothetical protein